MAGYCDYSKSNNAIEAEENGIYPLSHAKKIVAKKYKVAQVLAKLALQIHGPTEVHHTSCKFNLTDYYDTNIDYAQEVKEACRLIKKNQQQDEIKKRYHHTCKFNGKRFTDKFVWAGNKLICKVCGKEFYEFKNEEVKERNCGT